jgi:hypothetical protein
MLFHINLSIILNLLYYYLLHLYTRHYDIKVLHFISYLVQNLMKTRRKTSEVGEAMFKIIMTGDSGTGKSCLLNRYVKDTFNSEYHVTIGTFYDKLGA